METLTIHHQGHSYPVEIGPDLDQTQAIAPYLQQRRCAIISDSNVAPLYAQPLCKKIDNAHLFVVPHGEKNKTRETKAWLEDQMQQKELGRDTSVIAVGGGMITDLAGFVAATYCRGIPLILIPTSLLAMVDASIGGKNGVNTPLGKNLVGTFYHPDIVVMDTSTLQTLPQKEFRNGMVEVIKHALIADAQFFEYLENHIDNLQAIEQIIATSCRIKQSIVEQDVYECNLRRLLNFGHTIGHAIEKDSNYTISHGEAVAMGIIMESELSMKYAGLPQEHFRRIESLIRRWYPDLQIPNSELTEAMRLDKKAIDNIPQFVLLKEIGQGVRPAILRDLLTYFSNKSSNHV